jgi:LacI family transcriptional regulator
VHHPSSGPGIKDVAAAARVSVGTVSNVLNHPERVAAPTRERVLAAVERLGFVRNESARHLRARSSRVIGLIVLDASNPFEAGVAEGVAAAVEESGCVVLLGSSGGRLERERRYVELFAEQRVRGLLITPTHLAPPNLTGLSGRGIPVVFLDNHPDRTHSNVAVDDVAGGRIAVEHLLSGGHRRLAIVGGPWSLAQMQDRVKGAEEAILRQDGATLLRISTRGLTLLAGLEAADQLLALDPDERPTGVFAANDLVALGLLQRLLARGVRIPEDVALIGYDDIEFAASAAVPLSTVRLPREVLGRRAADLLFREIAAREAGEHVEPAQVLFEPELVARASTGSVEPT